MPAIPNAKVKSICKVIPPALIAAITLGVYSSTLLNGFVYDDNHILLGNIWVTDFRYASDILFSSLMSFDAAKTASNTYRPLLFFLFMAEHYVFGFKPLGFHLVNIVLHAANAVLVYYLAIFLLKDACGEGDRGRLIGTVCAVFAGLVNKRIVSAINAAGAIAVGVCGADGRILECALGDPELGFVGEPRSVHTEAIVALHSAGIVPVIGPIGFVAGELADQLVNVNADTVAGTIAAAMEAESVVFLTDVEGVLGADGAVIPSLTEREGRALIADGTISGGMIPKVEACLHAVSLGVQAQIVDGRRTGALLARSGSGTTFRA